MMKFYYKLLSFKGRTAFRKALLLYRNNCFVAMWFRQAMEYMLKSTITTYVLLRRHAGNKPHREKTSAKVK